MAYVFRIGAGDWTRCRFAVSRAHQVVNAVRLLRQRPPADPHSWIAHVFAADQPDRFGPLLELMPAATYGVDFLTPPPGLQPDGWEDELHRVALTDPEQVRQEIGRCLGEQGLPGAGAAVEALVDLMDQAWHQLVAPHWTQVADLLEADIARRATAVAHGGLGAGLADLAPDATLVGSAVVIGSGATTDIALRGRGLLLLPHAYGSTTGALWEKPWEPSIIYPVSGAWAARTSDQPSDALARLLGATRAHVLLALVDPATTSGLAARCELPLSTVSDHLAVLRASGLVSAVRRRYAVQHRRTPLGDALAAR